VGALLAGRMTLLEAAACFRDLNWEPPAFHWDYFRARWPGDSDDERHCHEVLAWVLLQTRGTGNARAGPDNCTAEAARTKLEAELAEHLRCGPLHLPEITRSPAFLDDE